MNRLADEKSPYLLQHAENPVDWFPWGEEAFERARGEDKPVFLSIGYATCHWCHVMERESFEDPHVAELMNEAFVNVKVDREERPDIDGVYMTVCQMLTGSGGWPLTIIMTPEKKPFYAATYIPRETRFGRVGMMDLVPRIRQMWRDQREEVTSTADRIVGYLHDQASHESAMLSAEILPAAYKELAEQFDEHYGGFRGAPKFPTPHNLAFLLRYWRRYDEPHALAMAEKTLQEMRRGGLYDHIGFGFHRYSTDERWLVPHFEKMLYDQALLTMAYVEAYQATGRSEYAETAREVLGYVLREMRSPEGGFHSAQDADSEGVEGRFYLWTQEEIKKVLGENEADLFMTVYNIERKGNFIEPMEGSRTGQNIPHLKESLERIATGLRIPVDRLRQRLEESRGRLFEARRERIQPGKDDKVLTDWNGLMIAAMAKAGRVLDEPAYVEAARSGAEFVLGRMRQEDGRLLHRYREGEAGIEGNLDDYAFLVWGLIELYEAEFEVGLLRTALALNGLMLADFWDEKEGGLFFAAEGAESPLVRQKQIYDGAVPSGNSVAMLNLLRLGRITANSDFEAKADRLARAFGSEVERLPAAYTQLLVAVDFGIGPTFELTVAGKKEAEDTQRMLRTVHSKFVPNKVVIHRPAGEDEPEIARFAEFVKNQTPLDDHATAYVCVNYGCHEPTTDPQRVVELLEGRSA